MNETVGKPIVFMYVILALFGGAIIGMIVAKTVLREDIATSYMVDTCIRSQDDDSKYYRCDYF